MSNDLEMAKKLVRWRADPEKIRVSIRNNEGSWQATVTCRLNGESVSSNSLQSPNKAIMVALRKADKKGFNGVDIGMQWAYEHPWK